MIMNVTKISLITIWSALLISCGPKTDLKQGEWHLSYNRDNKSLSIKLGGYVVIEGLYASYKLKERLITTNDYMNYSIQHKPIKDNFGKGTLLKITYKSDTLPVLQQSFYVYDDKEYILTDFTLENKKEKVISSNYMAPVNIDKIVPTDGTGENRALFVPFDNDCWVRYKAYSLNFDSLCSYEVTSIYENSSRNGLVIGSVEHDNWKTAILMKGGNTNSIKELTCYGGVANELTRDTKVHGALRGKKIKSPKIFIGYFDDWRDGMDEFGKANAVVAAPKEWKGAMPVGWNSWGALKFDLTYAKALEVSDFFKDNLQNKYFINEDNTVIIGLDSGWNSFSEEELKSFVDKCTNNGQIAGIYWTPFTDWGKKKDKTIEEAPSYKYEDAYIYANGNPQELDGAYALDPTHPAIEQRMKKTSELFRRCGFKYIKMDFMTHGMMEGNKWYNPSIQTGTQAYNYGMQLINKYFGDMYINLSISPIFPAQYAHSRRIACDAWNKMKDTEYTLNALSYGWWINNIYQFNDADHVVLRDATEGENRARVTSAVITGLYIVGDDFSRDGSEEDKDRAKKYLTNSDVNAVANGRSFRPVEGNGENSENQFVRIDEDGTIYYAIFNYNDQGLTINIPYERIGIDMPAKYKVKDLWSGKDFDINKKLTVLSKDVRLMKFTVSKDI